MLRRTRSAVVVVWSVAVLASGIACGEAPEASGDAAPTTVVADAATSAPGTAPAAEVLVTDGIGEDDAFPELGTPDLDVDDYALDLRYDPRSGELEGSVTIRAEVTRDTDELELDFQGLEVDAASVDHDLVDVDVDARRDKLTIGLPQTTAAGTDVTIVVDYHGAPEPVATEALGGVEVGWHAGPEGSFVLSEPEGASTWYPVNNHPLDKATYSFRVTVPAPFTAIANGELVGSEQVTDGTTFEWRMDAPMASYLATVVTGEFDQVDGGVHDGVSYSYWYPAGVAPSPSLEQSDRDVALLASHLGPFPFTTYGGIVYPASFITGSERTRGFLSGVALENQGISLFAAGAVVPSVVLHEAAHQWMGDSVSLSDWSRDIWWVEGFAYFAEHVDDPDQLADDYPQIRADWQPPGDLRVDDLFLGCAYECGAMVFYALYREVGADTFWAILREFTSRYRHANASTGDLIAVAGEVSGDDLTAFFDAWLFDETPPKLPA